MRWAVLALVLGACPTPLEPAELPPAPLPDPDPPVAFTMEVPVGLAREIEPPPPAPADSGAEGPTGEVRLDGEPIIVGALGLAEFVAVVDEHRADLQRCTRSRLPEPKVIVKLTVVDDGTVSGASMKVESGSWTVDRCLEKAFMKMKFPMEQDGLVVAAVPLDLGAERGPAPAPPRPPPEDMPPPPGPPPAPGAPTPDGSSAPPG